MPTFWETYTDFKALVSALTATVYYIETDLHYGLIIVNLASNKMYRTDVTKSPINTADLADFETVLKPTAVAVDTVDEAVAEEVLP